MAKTKQIAAQNSSKSLDLIYKQVAELKKKQAVQIHKDSGRRTESRVSYSDRRVKLNAL